MLLPSATIRASLKLDTPAKRFAWAAEQLHAALTPSPAVAADINMGIVAKVPNKGANPLLPSVELIKYMRAESTPTRFSCDFYLPLIMPQYNRGLSLYQAVGELSPDTVPSYLGDVAAGDPILDNSTSKTVEQYLIEQLSLMIVANISTVDFSESTMLVQNLRVDLSDYTSRIVPAIYVKCGLNRTGMVGSNRYGDITGIVTV